MRIGKKRKHAGRSAGVPAGLGYCQRDAGATFAVLMDATKLEFVSAASPPDLRKDFALPSAENLTAPALSEVREFFAEFTQSRAEGLRMTGGGLKTVD
jgi:hypothetical protein